MWARHYAACIDCGTTERKHFGGGRCWKCYQRYAYRKNPGKFRALGRLFYARHAEKVKQQAREYYATHKEEAREATRGRRNRLDFDGIREAVLARDEHKCIRCGSDKQLLVHHIDGTGRSVSYGQHNNNPENLTTFCRACHLREHKPRKKLRLVLDAQHIQVPWGGRYILRLECGHQRVMKASRWHQTPTKRVRCLECAVTL